MDNNPNMIDSLFVPRECITHTTKVGEMVREKRHIFLHKGSWHKYKGYAYSQLNKMGKKDGDGNRQASIAKYGYDVKQGYHLVRLLDEIEQILTTHDLDLRRNRAQLKAIRRGEVPEEAIRRWASEKEKSLEKAYEKSKLPWGPDEVAIKRLLLQCLEEHYGTLDNAIFIEDSSLLALREVADVIDRNRRILG